MKLAQAIQSRYVKLAALKGRLTSLLINRRKRILALVLVLAVLVVVAENLIYLRFGNTLQLWFDGVVFLMITPLALWAMLSLLANAASEREKATLDSDMRSEFSQKVGDAVSWDDLVSRIVEYCHQTAPQAIATLYVYNPTSLRMEPEARCRRDGSMVMKPAVSINPDTLPVGSLPQLWLQAGEQSAVTRAAFSPPPPPLPPHRFDLPISRNDQLLGVIKLEYPLGSAPAASQTRTLTSAAPVIALALEVAILQKLAVEQAEVSDSQRQHIAQNLHDTLAQNISYLRLKLDQLTGENAILEIGSVLQELERMRATADEAYQQVRNTLDELNPIQGEDLSTVIFKQAQAIGSRAGFALNISRIGEAYPLPSSTRQQILYIVREALHNVEKHSRATIVQLQFCWLDGELIIKITDNGVGFNPRAVTTDGHYGLWIMQHRAQELGGTVKIVPAQAQGTEVTLWVPRAGFETTPTG